jgi:hypothetical protein
MAAAMVQDGAPEKMVNDLLGPVSEAGKRRGVGRLDMTRALGKENKPDMRRAKRDGMLNRLGGFQPANLDVEFHGSQVA